MGIRSAVSPAGRVSIVIVTRNRRDELLTTLRRLRHLPERPPIVVVDNDSSDGTPDVVRRDDRDVELIPLPANMGAAARNIGVRLATTPLVAFCDDDSWWEPGALSEATALFDREPALGLVAAHVLVHPQARPDPTCALMADSPLRTTVTPAGPVLPGNGRTAYPAVLGFLACGAVVRRSAFLSTGGFAPDLGIGGEEASLSLAMAAAGWKLLYAEELVAHHHPSPVRDRRARGRRLVRNELWTTWAHRRAGSALIRTGAVLGRSLRRPGDALGLADALQGMPAVLARRAPVPVWLDRAARLVDRRTAGSPTVDEELPTRCANMGSRRTAP